MFGFFCFVSLLFFFRPAYQLVPFSFPGNICWFLLSLSILQRWKPKKTYLNTISIHLCTRLTYYKKKWDNVLTEYLLKPLVMAPKKEHYHFEIAKITFTKYVGSRQWKCFDDKHKNKICPISTNQARFYNQ